MIPAGVTATVSDKKVSVKGPKGNLELDLPIGVFVKQEGSEIIVSPDTTNDQSPAMWGLVRTLIQNLITGVTAGFEKKLEINGVGFKAAMQGTNLVLNVGFSHQVNFAVPKGIEIKVEKNVISVSGIDKYLVGQTAANIRKIKKPEPYKGKGIKYSDEVIIRKEGKTVKAGQQFNLKYMLKQKNNLQRRQARIRAVISGTADRPRISVSKSLAHISVQVIDDSKGLTLVSASDRGIAGTKTERSVKVGEMVGKKMLEKGLNKGVFDRRGRKYHGRIQALADAIRSAGVQF